MLKFSAGVWAALLIGTAISAPARAQDSDGTDPELELGGARFSPSLRSVGYYTDNFYNQPANEAASLGALVNPELSFLKESSRLRLAGGVEAEYGTFDLPGGEDDYLDAGARLTFAAQATVRNQFRLGGSFKRGHDAFGVNRTEDATVRDDELDRWDQVIGSLHYRYGAAGARLNAEVGVTRLERSYVTNRGATEVLNYDSVTTDYTLFYNLGPKTTVLLDFSRSDYSFERPFGLVDTRAGELYRLRTGMRWLATGKTTGDVRVGYRRRLFDTGSPDIEGLDWEVGIDWSPIPRTQLRFGAARSEQQSYRADTRVIDVDSLTASWRYNLTARTRSTVAVEHLNVDFDTSGRDDEILGGSLGLEHALISYLWVVGNVGTTTRDSTFDTRDYDRLTAYLGVRLGR